MQKAATPWNLNIHYHQVVLDAVPPRVITALDVGCGPGLLSFDLADRGLQVTGIDPHEPSIERARAHPRATDRTTFVCDDLFTYEAPAAGFDVVASSAMLHHVDAVQGLRRMRELVSPGGVLALVCFAQPSTASDWARSAAGLVVKRIRTRTQEYWDHQAPLVWPPPLTRREMAVIAEKELPGSTFTGLMSRRYSLVWHAPK